MDTAAVNAILRDTGVARDPTKVVEVAGWYSREEIEPSPGVGAHLEPKPARRIAECSAELETVKQAEPGTFRDACAEKASPDSDPKSPAPDAKNDWANEPAEMNMDRDMSM